MRKSQALAALFLAALSGVAAGQIVPRLIAAHETAKRAALAEAERKAAEARALEAEQRWAELALKLNGEEAAGALAEAQKLGILDEIAAERPSLKPDAVRRVAIALVTEAHRHHLDPLLLAALARVESRFDPYATSGMGAVGLLQIRPPTGKAMAEKDGAKIAHDAELYDIETNVALGARYLADLQLRYPRLEQALLAYNRGPESARKVLTSPDAEAALAGYPKLVLAERERLAEKARRRQGG